MVDNVSYSKIFHNFKKFTQTMSARLLLSPCLPQTFESLEYKQKIRVTIKTNIGGEVIDFFRHSFHQLLGLHADF